MPTIDSIVLEAATAENLDHVDIVKLLDIVHRENLTEIQFEDMIQSFRFIKGLEGTEVYTYLKQYALEFERGEMITNGLQEYQTLHWALKYMVSGNPTYMPDVALRYFRGLVETHGHLSSFKTWLCTLVDHAEEMNRVMKTCPKLRTPFVVWRGVYGTNLGLRGVLPIFSSCSVDRRVAARFASKRGRRVMKLIFPIGFPLCFLELTGELEVLGPLGMEIVEKEEENGDIVCEVLPRIKDDEIDFTAIKRGIFARPREFFQSLYDKHYSKYAASNAGTEISNLEGYDIKPPSPEEVAAYQDRYGSANEPNEDIRLEEHRRAEEIYRGNLEQARLNEEERRAQARIERSKRFAEKKVRNHFFSKHSAKLRKLRSSKRKSKRLEEKKSRNLRSSNKKSKKIRT